MDFMKWLSSLDELLYEVMSWLLFFPLTLWRSLVEPLRTMRLVEEEAVLPDAERYAAVLSPPLFLALGLLLSHAASMALGEQDAIVANSHGLASLVSDATTALLLRVVVFASVPLFLAARLVRRSGRRLDRQSLQLPFYQQCFPGAVLALGVSLGTSLATASLSWSQPVGAAAIIASLLFFLVVEVRWFAMADGRYGRAAASVAIGLFQGAVFILFIGFLFTRQG